MIIESLVFRPMVGGTRNGLPTLELRLGSDGPSFSNTELVGRILMAAGEFSVHSRILVVKDFASANDPWEITELVDALKDNFMVMSWTPGVQKPGWTGVAVMKRVTVGNEPWLMHRADEIVYAPEPDDQWIEPAIGPANKDSWRGIYVGKKVDGRKVLSFIKGASLPWMVVSAPLVSYEVQIL